jgi:hypothetical protein
MIVEVHKNIHPVTNVDQAALKDHAFYTNNNQHIEGLDEGDSCISIHCNIHPLYPQDVALLAPVQNLQRPKTL